MNMDKLDGWTRLWIVIALSWMLFVTAWGAYEFHVGGLFSAFFFVEFITEPQTENRSLNAPWLDFRFVETVFLWRTFLTWLLIPVVLGSGLMVSARWISAGFKKQ